MMYYCTPDSFYSSERMLIPQEQLSGTSEPVLRSGLYVVRPLNATKTEEQIYILYWPQDTTWSDDAFSAVQRNRVTFMRYVSCRIYVVSGCSSLCFA